MFGLSSYSEAPYSALALNDYQLSCSAGSYTITGGAATFSYVRTVAGDAGSYVVTGNNAGVIYDKVLQGNAGNYTFTGNDAGLDYDQVLNAEGGSFTITGNSASFATGKSLFAGTFNFLMTGQQAGLRKATLLNTLPGSYTITGGSAEFVKGKMIIASAGNYTFTGQDATFDYHPIPVMVTETKGGIGKKRKTKIDTDREQREQLEAIVKREFDILDGTYVPEAVEAIKQEIMPQINKIDWAEYQIALAQVNALLLQAKIRVAEYESELDDEEALVMLL